MNFLRTLALRVSDDFSYDAHSIHGVDWSSSYSSPAGSVQTVTVPLLTLGMTGHWEYLATERCEKTPGQYGDTLKTTYDYVDRWLSKPGRF